MQIEKGRVGTFFIFIGLVLLVIFFIADQNQSPQVGFFFSGLIMTFLGVYLIWKDWKPRRSSSRFRLIRKLNRKPEDKEGQG